MEGHCKECETIYGEKCKCPNIDPFVRPYDIAENQGDLYCLASAEPNLRVDYAAIETAHPEIFCGENGPKRSINNEDYEIEVLEITGIFGGEVTIAKQDVMAMAKHYGLIK